MALTAAVTGDASNEATASTPAVAAFAWEYLPG
jgi:hypothetical protein